MVHSRVDPVDLAARLSEVLRRREEAAARQRAAVLADYTTARWGAAWLRVIESAAASGKGR